MNFSYTEQGQAVAFELLSGNNNVPTHTNDMKHLFRRLMRIVEESEQLTGTP
jgi:hypothetical protein